MPVRLPLPTLLSRALVAFTIEFDNESEHRMDPDHALEHIHNLEGRPLGVSKEANAMAVGFLQRHGCAVVEPDPTASRAKVVRLTQKSHKARDKFIRILALTERRWLDRFGEPEIADLRQASERLVGDDPNPENSRRFQGLVPYPDGGRASVRKPQTLPHYPMVLHPGRLPRRQLIAIVRPRGRQTSGVLLI